RHTLSEVLIANPHTRWKLVNLKANSFAVVLNSVVHDIEYNKIVMLTQADIRGYSPCTPAKSGVGISLLDNQHSA
ncbi:Rha family phage regulatory protein, partial [Salmonella enterica]